MFLSLCWLLICEDDIYWMSHNPKHTITCGSNADIPLLLMGRTLWQRVIYSNWNLNHFFSSGTSPCLVMDQHQQKCRTRFLPLQAANSLFEENFICKVRHLHFVTLCLHSYTLRVVFFYHSQFIFCQHGVFQNWIKGINAEKFFSNSFLNFVLVV